MPASLYVGGMESNTFLYRCPITGHEVQGLVPGNTGSTDDTRSAKAAALRNAEPPNSDGGILFGSYEKRESRLV